MAEIEGNTAVHVFVLLDCISLILFNSQLRKPNPWLILPSVSDHVSQRLIYFYQYLLILQLNKYLSIYRGIC
jgi:hypothetical protein